MGQTNYIHVGDCGIVRKTDKAVLVRLPDGREEWIPLSQMPPDDADRLEEDDTHVTVTMSEWIAEQKGIDPDEYE